MEREIEVEIIIDRIIEGIERSSKRDDFLSDKAPNLISLGKQLESYYKELGELNDYYK
jgi:hypothetical protein